MARPRITLKRVYEPLSDADGVRILVERLWPRGVSKANAAIDHWVKDVAPTPELRTWYGHEPARWEEFRERYRAELTENTVAVDTVKSLCVKQPVTFIFAAKDEARNSAVVLREFLLSKSGARR